MLSVILIADPTVKHSLIPKSKLPDHLLWMAKISNCSGFLQCQDKMMRRASNFTWRYRNGTKSKLYLCDCIIYINYRCIHLWTSKITLVSWRIRSLFFLSIQENNCRNLKVFLCYCNLYRYFSLSVKIYVPSIYTFHYQKNLFKFAKLTDFKFLCFDPDRDFQICKMLALSN